MDVPLAGSKSLGTPQFPCRNRIERMNQEIKKTRIVIAGGGFAGLYAAKYLDKGLAQRSDIEVTLISRENFILFTPMLHEVVAGDLHRRRTLPATAPAEHRHPSGPLSNQ